MSKHSLTYRAVGDQVPMKNRLLLAASQLFTQKGYHAASLSEIAEMCGLQKSSVFHHFASKQLIALEAIKVLHQYCEDQVFKIVTDIRLSPEQRVINFITAIQSFMIDRSDSGLVGFLAIELIDVIPSFNIPIREYFTAWLSAMSAVLTPTHGKAQAQQLSQHAMIYLQGVHIMTRIGADNTYIHQSSQYLLNLWKASK